MKKLNTTNDALFYLTTDYLTSPFMDDYVLRAKIMKDLKAHIGMGEKYSIIDSLINYIHRYVKPSEDKDFNAEYRFNRTAKEIWKSCLSTGCTDYALLFCTFARQLGLPTTFVSAIGRDYYYQLKRGKAPAMHKGHAFCECCINTRTEEGQPKKQWILVDPTTHAVMEDYLKDGVIKLNYRIANNSTFIPFYRGVDIGEKTHSANWNKKMDDFISGN